MSYYRYDNKYGLEYGQGVGEPIQEMYQRTYPDIVPVTHSMTREQAEQTYVDLRRSEPKKTRHQRKPSETPKKNDCNTGFCEK